jgi:hypothetical protein
MNARARLFFALWPDQAVRGELAAWASALHREVGGRVTKTESIHLTLLFLGEVEPERFDAARELGSPVSSPSFELTLDTAGCWKHNGVAWAAPGAVPAPLAASGCRRPRRGLRSGAPGVQATPDPAQKGAMPAAAMAAAGADRVANRALRAGALGAEPRSCALRRDRQLVAWGKFDLGGFTTKAQRHKD